MITQGDQASDVRTHPSYTSAAWSAPLNMTLISARFPTCVNPTHHPTMSRALCAPHSKKETFMPRTPRHPFLIGACILAIGVLSTLALSLRPTSAVAQDRGDRAGSSANKGQPLATKDISLDQAHTVIAAAVKKAQ